jgi:ATP-dependent DNA helicase PIF1
MGNAPSIRRLFPMILVFGEPSNVRGLWDKHLEAMGEDYHFRQTLPVV